MNTFLQVQKKNASIPAWTFMNVQNGLLQRKCDKCHKNRQWDRGTNLVKSPSGLSIRDNRPNSHDQYLEQNNHTIMQAGYGHNLDRIHVTSPQEQFQPRRMIGDYKVREQDSAELPLYGEELEPGIDLAQKPSQNSPPSEPADAGEAAKSCCGFESFTASNDSYTDTATDTRKNIKFTYKAKAGSDPKKCVMVNWIQGTAKNKDGTFRKVKMFDKTVDYNFPAMRIDSLDKDPVYWSNSSARWNYSSGGTDEYYATDSPGPQVWEDGIDYDLKFKMCLHCIDDVSATSDESGSGVKNPLKCINWVFKAKYDATAKKFTH